MTKYKILSIIKSIKKKEKEKMKKYGKLKKLKKVTYDAMDFVEHKAFAVMNFVDDKMAYAVYGTGIGAGLSLMLGGVGYVTGAPEAFVFWQGFSLAAGVIVGTATNVALKATGRYL